MDIREAAKKAYEERQANIAERDREYRQDERDRNRRNLLDAIKRVFDIEPDDPHLQMDDDSGYALLDGLWFRYDEGRDGELRRLQVKLPCHLCGEPSWQEIGDLVDLGYCLADPENVTHPAFTCQWKEEEKSEQPAETEPWQGSFCPLINDNCCSDRCVWWSRCQAENELAGASLEVRSKEIWTEIQGKLAEIRPAEQPAAPRWALLELMGHGHLVGQITEELVAGVPMIRVDVPETEKTNAYSKYFSRGALYAITVVDEATALAMHQYRQPSSGISPSLLPYEENPTFRHDSSPDPAAPRQYVDCPACGESRLVVNKEALECGNCGNSPFYVGAVEPESDEDLDDDELL